MNPKTKQENGVDRGSFRHEPARLLVLLALALSYALGVWYGLQHTDQAALAACEVELVEIRRVLGSSRHWYAEDRREPLPCCTVTEGP